MQESESEDERRYACSSRVEAFDDEGDSCMLGDDEEFRLFHAHKPQSSTDSGCEYDAQIMFVHGQQPYAEHDRFIPHRQNQSDLHVNNFDTKEILFAQLDCQHAAGEECDCKSKNLSKAASAPKDHSHRMF